MPSPYAVFKFLHILAVIVWIGGVITMSLLSARVGRERDGAALRFLLRQSAFLGQMVLGPAALLTLFAGFALMGVLRSGFTLWMAWGVAGIAASIALGAIVMRPVTLRLMELAEAAPADDARIAEARRRLGRLGLVNLAVLLSTVWAMVAKPTL
jgi:uncharacterized membrane protein